MEWVGSSSQKLTGHKITKCFFHTASIIGYYIYILTFITYFKILFITPVQFALQLLLNRHLERLFFSKVIAHEIQIKY